MTTDHPTEKFVMIRHSVINAGLTPQAFTLYAALMMYADWTTGETYVSRQTLAEHIGAKQPRSVDRYVREMLESELILSVQHRWTTQRRDMNDVVFEKDADHPVQTSSLYVVNLAPEFSQVSPQCARTHGGGALERTGVVRQNAHNLEPLTYNHLSKLEKSSVSEADRADSSGVVKPIALPETWTPNATHVRVATSKGLNVDVLADSFRAGVRANRERRCDWDAAFGAFINEYADGREKVTFPHDDDVEDEFEPTTSIDTTPDPTTEALKWALGALWAENINPDTLTADERTTITLAWGDEPAADVARLIRENRELRHLAVVPNPMTDADVFLFDVSDNCGIDVDDMSAAEQSYCAWFYNHAGDAETVASELLRARTAAEVVRRAGDDPTGMSIVELLDVHYECEYATADPVDAYRAMSA